MHIGRGSSARHGQRVTFWNDAVYSRHVSKRPSLRDVFRVLPFYDDLTFILIEWKNTEHAERLFKRIIEEELGIIISEKEDVNGDFRSDRSII